MAEAEKETVLSATSIESGMKQIIQSCKIGAMEKIGAFN
jgi:hypothetical protein